MNSRWSTDFTARTTAPNKSNQTYTDLLQMVKGSGFVIPSSTTSVMGNVNPPNCATTNVDNNNPSYYSANFETAPFVNK